MKFDVIVVGGGASGLTAAAYLAKSGHSTLLLERQPRCGGLINSFVRNGFTFDGGLRALDNAGVLFPMMRQLGIELDLVKNHISLGIEDQIISVESDDDLDKYENLLKSLYPESSNEISAIIIDIKRIMHYMDVQYGIDNPLFLDIKQDRDYFIRQVFPWMFKYAITAPKISKINYPVLRYLQKFTDNQALLDIIAQHFFTETPAYFALSYFKLYQDYFYPSKGTGEFINQLSKFIEAHGGEIRTSTIVQLLDIEKKTLKTSAGEEYEYRHLIWAADQKSLYQMIDLDSLSTPRITESVLEKRRFLEDKKGNDSVLTLYLSVDLDKSYFERISAGHFFYTPSRKGQSLAGRPPKQGGWKEIENWLQRFFTLTTYEISIPVLRNSSLAPEGKTGLIISALFDYQFTKFIYDRGWDEKFRSSVGEMMVENLEKSVYPGLKNAIIDQFVATPITIQQLTGNTDGAITGWSFTNQPVPAESRLVKIANSVKTPLPNVTQAGQWTYSPSGLPVALITGKLASDRAHKKIK
jgi:phytoene dehydrogenase-like protein